MKQYPRPPDPAINKTHGHNEYVRQKREARKVYDTLGICGARNRTDGSACGRQAGLRTPHPGVGYCNLHGGCYDLRDHKQGMVSGIAETIKVELMPDGRDLLTPEERAKWDAIPTDAKDAITKQLFVEGVRIERMEKRRDQAEAMLLSSPDGLYQSKREHKKGTDMGKDVDWESLQHSPIIGLVQKIENDITIAKATYQRLIETKNKIELQQSNGGKTQTICMLGELIDQMKALDKQNDAAAAEEAEE